MCINTQSVVFLKNQHTISRGCRLFDIIPILPLHSIKAVEFKIKNRVIRRFYPPQKNQKK